MYDYEINWVDIWMPDFNASREYRFDNIGQLLFDLDS